MRSINAYLISLTLLMPLSCWSKEQSSWTGFVSNNVGATPIMANYSGKRQPINIAVKSATTVLIYMHGTTNSTQVQRCSGRVPEVLTTLASENIAIFYLCSNAVESVSLVPGNYIFTRLDEVSQVLSELETAGIKPENIFLAGHSAGGWTSLMAAQHFPGQFAGSIAFAPAFAGKTANRSHWWQLARQLQTKKMLSAPDMNALVFAYYNDPFEDPASLSFLTAKYPATVHMANFKCNQPHTAIYTQCELAAKTALIVQFLAANRKP